MSFNNRVDIESLQSFMELTEEDQERCYDKFVREPLLEKHVRNKYLKHTDYIEALARANPLENDCFLAYDVYPVNYKYSAVVFAICGITHQFFHVLYMSVIEEMKLDDPNKYICALLSNIILVEIPKLESFALKFVLCRDTEANTAVIQLFAAGKKTAKYSSMLPFIREPSRLKNSQLHIPYAQKAWLHILHGEFNKITMRDVFQRYLDLATSKENERLKSFVEEYQQLARELLDTRNQVTLRLCTMERMDTFERIVRAHMKSFSDRIVTRHFIFDLIRALIHIYSNC
ncbi:hypothetical protein KR222_002665 [Zaprionus bogoriensis]|nr:hypothetical protein KR222_002665 [Zaprionus bogoriensis]